MRQLKITHQITNRDSESLERYLQEIGKVELLTPEQEAELAKRIKTGDQAALESLTKANLRFVVSVAKQYQNQGLTLSDLINEGNVGLIKAAKRFDETKGFKFISYAVWWIRQSIMQSLVEQSRMVRLPLNKIGSYNRINKTMANFEQEFEREPTNDELADLLNVSVKDVKEMLKGITRHMSMDAPIGDSDETTMKDMMVDEDDNKPDQTLITDSLRSDIMRVMSVLSRRDAEIVACFFGINGRSQMNLDEIGEKFDLTRERVRQIKEKAIRRLRKTRSCNSLKTYLH
jgi:RNA polymerase primary sigma factor